MKKYTKPVIVAEMKIRKAKHNTNNKKNVFSAAWKNGCISTGNTF